MVWLEKLALDKYKKKKSFASRSLFKWRDFPVYELLSYVLMFASVPMLAYGIKPYNFQIIRIIFLTIITLYSGFFAALFWNDITDSEIDRIAHPNRLIPSKRISKNRLFAVALFFSALTFIFAVLISIWCLFLVGLSAIFVATHNKYLKRRVKFPAFSEIFSPLQWTVVAIFGFIAIWTALPQSNSISFDLYFIGNISTSSSAIFTMIILFLFTYFLDDSHDISEGIADYDADKRYEIRTYATSFGKLQASKISFIMFILSAVFGVILFFQSILSPFFLIFFLILTLYNFKFPFKLIKTKKEELKEQGVISGRKMYDYFLFTYNLIFIDLLIQILFLS
jgi:4-hydroxybenzoate polyprenyltransferase